MKASKMIRYLKIAALSFRLWWVKNFWVEFGPNSMSQSVTAAILENKIARLRRDL